MRIPARPQLEELLRSETRLVVRFALTAAGRSLLTVAGVLLIREFLGGVLGGGDGLASVVSGALGANAALWVVAGLLVATYVAASLCNYDNQVTQQRLVKALELGLVDRLIRHLLTLSISFFDRQSHGDIIQAVRQDISQLRVTVMSFGRMLIEGVLALGLLACAVWMSPELTMYALVLLPAVSIPVLVIARRALARSFPVRRSGYVVFDVILQILRGIRIIKAYRGEDAEADRAVAKSRRYFDELLEMVRTRALSAAVFESVAGLSMVAAIIVGGFRVMEGALDWPTLLAFLVAVRALHGPLNNVTTSYVQMQQYGASVERINALFAERPDVRDRPEALALGRALEEIEFDDVGFSYGEAVVLQHLRFRVRAGETLGIVGPSGSGKSTLLGLVARFYDPTQGVVRLDGRDLRDYRMADVYDALAIVTQEPFLFDANVRENIRCGRPSASDIEVEYAARAAGIHDEILELPDGYETSVGVGGRPVSGGQAQRINVARAVLKNAPLLLLDEATSRLDSIAEAKMQQAVDSLMLGRTTFVVAHRLSTLRTADRILVLDAGRCVGLGSHDELLRECPLYGEMWQTQQSGLGDLRPAPDKGASSSLPEEPGLEEPELVLPGDDAAIG